MALEQGDHTGQVERAWIMAQLTTLVGGRAWETGVPDDATIPADEAGRLYPYLIARFARPLTIRAGRNVGSGEKGQPRQLSFTVLALGGVKDDVRDTLTAALDLLDGERPSLTANAIQLRGGFAYGQAESGSRPTRFEEAGFGRTIFNI
jgi:hypothetical protein